MSASLLLSALAGIGAAHASVGTEIGAGVTYTSMGTGTYEAAAASWRGEKWGLKLGAMRNLRAVFQDEDSDPRDLVRAFQAAVELPGLWTVQASVGAYPVPFGFHPAYPSVHLVPVDAEVARNGWAMMDITELQLRRRYEDRSQLSEFGEAIKLFVMARYIRYTVPTNGLNALSARYRVGTAEGVDGEEFTTVGAIERLADPGFGMHELRLTVPNIPEYPVESLVRCRANDDDECTAPVPLIKLRRPRFAMAIQPLPVPLVSLGLGWGRTSRELMDAIDDVNESYREDYAPYTGEDADADWVLADQIDVRRNYVTPTFAIGYKMDVISAEIPLQSIDSSITFRISGAAEVPARTFADDVARPPPEVLFTTATHVGLARW
jgi:hypothetical protein